MSVNAWYKWINGDLILRLHVQPGARTTAFAELYDGRIRLRVTAPPQEGKANETVIDYLAGQFRVARSQVRIKQGQAGTKQSQSIDLVDCRICPD